jgi:hypothetical protein
MNFRILIKWKRKIMADYTVKTIGLKSGVAQTQAPDVSDKVAYQAVSENNLKAYKVMSVFDNALPEFVAFYTEKNSSLDQQKKFDLALNAQGTNDLLQMSARRVSRIDNSGRPLMEDATSPHTLNDYFAQMVSTRTNAHLQGAKVVFLTQEQIDRAYKVLVGDSLDTNAKAKLVQEQILQDLPLQSRYVNPNAVQQQFKQKVSVIREATGLKPGQEEKITVKYN